MKIKSFQVVVQTLNKTVVDLQQKATIPSDQNEQLSETLQWKLNVLIKSSLLTSELEQNETVETKKVNIKMHKIIFGRDFDSRWEVFLKTIDALYPGFPQFLRNGYPQFTETDFKVALLSYIGLSGKEIAILIDQSVNTVNMSRTRIRKKMNLKESRADFCEIFKQSYTATHPGLN